MAEVRKLTLEMGMVNDDDVDVAGLQLHPAEVDPVDLADPEPLDEA